MEYKVKEELLFKFLKEEYYPDLELLSYEVYSGHDAISDDEEVFVELKCRNTHYDNLMIEKIKYDHMISIASALNYGALYICETPKGIWQFNLLKTPPKWEERDDLPATTSFINTNRVTKTVGYLNINQGKILYPVLDDPWDQDFDYESLVFDGDDSVFVVD